MKKAEYNKMQKRLALLIDREQALKAVIESSDMSDDALAHLVAIATETRSEIFDAARLLESKREYLFNFTSGGWNSEYAFYEEQAIKQAIKKYGNPVEGGRGVLDVDVKSFRVSTPADYKNLLSMFY
jgi:hypothetical protein